MLLKEFDHITGVHTSDLAAKRDFIVLKVDVDKWDINKLVNFPSTLNNLKIKVDDLDIGKLKTVPVNLKNLSDAVDNEVVKNTKFNTLNTKVNNLEKINSWCNYINSCKSIQHRQVPFIEKIRDVDKKIPDTSGLVSTTVF